MTTVTDKDIKAYELVEEISKYWQKGLTRASFGGAKGNCQLTGVSTGFVALYLCEDEAQLEDDFKSGKKVVLSVSAYKDLKATMDALHPTAPPPPKPVKIVLTAPTKIVLPAAVALTP